MDERQLSELRPQSMSATDDGEFRDFGYVCLFTEHVDRDGNRFDKAAMERITKRCNDRIVRRKAFAPIVIRHNGEGRDPEVIGLCGPYRLGKIESDDGKGMVAAVYGRMRVYRDDAHKVRKYPYRSVEFWCSKTRPTDGYFHPVSLLGSEMPELDLPVLYGKAEKAGMRCVKYSRLAHYAAASPGGTNVVLPGMVEEKKPKTYEKASKLMLSPEDIQQIVAAMGPVIEAKIAEMNPAPQVDDEMPPAGEPDGDEMPPEMPPVDEAAPVDAPPVEEAAPEIAEDKPEEKPEAQPVEAGKPDEEDDESPVAKKYMKERDEVRTLYQKAVTDLREITAKHDELAAVVEGSKREARRAVRYQKLNDLKAQGFVIVPDEEIADVQDLTDAAFGKFTDTVVKKYQRIPLNMIPVPKGIETDSDNDKKLVKYQKEAFELCEAATKKGEHIPFREALDRVRKSYEHKPAA